LNGRLIGYAQDLCGLKPAKKESQPGIEQRTERA
jgi:hypothetical protein